MGCRLLELVWPEASHPSPPPLPFLLESSSRNLDQKESQGLELGSWCKDASCMGQEYLVPVDRARELACLQWAYDPQQDGWDRVWTQEPSKVGSRKAMKIRGRQEGIHTLYEETMFCCC